MDEHPGCVDHAAQARAAGIRKLRERRFDEITRIAAGTDLGAGQLEHCSHCGNDERPRGGGQSLVREQSVD